MKGACCSSPSGIILIFEPRKEEPEAIFGLLWQARDVLGEKVEPDAYNTGVNSGIPAGPTIMHLHVHLIPRYNNDVDDPTGGVRGVVPAKQKYLIVLRVR